MQSLEMQVLRLRRRKKRACSAQDDSIFIRAFSEDEYQSCSGIGHGANKKTVVVEKKDSAGAEAHLYFVAFAARLKSCPVTKHCPFIPWAAEPELT
jgi:hypothetical protein